MKHMTVAECEARYPGVFLDENGNKDKRLTERLKRFMTHMISEGVPLYDAKLKVLCMGKPPDHFEEVPPGGAYPRMLYLKGGNTCRVEDEQEHAAKKKAGWLDKPLQEHLDKAQRSTIPADERISRLKKELDAEIAAKAREVAA